MENKGNNKKVKKNVAFTIDVKIYDKFLSNYPFINKSLLIELFLNEINSQVSEEDFWNISREFKDKNQITIEIWKLFKKKLCQNQTKDKTRVHMDRGDL